MNQAPHALAKIVPGDFLAMPRLSLYHLSTLHHYIHGLAQLLLLVSNYGYSRLYLLLATEDYVK